MSSSPIYYNVFNIFNSYQLQIICALPFSSSYLSLFNTYQEYHCLILFNGHSDFSLVLCTRHKITEADQDRSLKNAHMQNIRFVDKKVSGTLISIVGYFPLNHSRCPPSYLKISHKYTHDVYGQYENASFLLPPLLCSKCYVGFTII